MKRLNAKRLIRCTARACFALAFVVALIWLASGWFGCTFSWGPTRALELYAGRIEYSNMDPLPLPIGLPIGGTGVKLAGGWHLWQRTVGPRWRYDVEIQPTSLTQNNYGIPLWPIPPALLALSALALYRSRLIPAHLCTHCRYDRRGILASAPCPECGTNPKPTDQPT